jgi:hypothetical protein
VFNLIIYCCFQNSSDKSPLLNNSSSEHMFQTMSLEIGDLLSKVWKYFVQIFLGYWLVKWWTADMYMNDVIRMVTSPEWWPHQNGDLISSAILYWLLKVWALQILQSFWQLYASMGKITLKINFPSEQRWWSGIRAVNSMFLTFCQCFMFDCYKYMDIEG